MDHVKAIWLLAAFAVFSWFAISTYYEFRVGLQIRIRKNKQPRPSERIMLRFFLLLAQTAGSALAVLFAYAYIVSHFELTNANYLDVIKPETAGAIIKWSIVFINIYALSIGGAIGLAPSTIVAPYRLLCGRNGHK